MASTRSSNGVSDTAGIRLRIQRLPGPLQALAVGGLAALRHEDGSFGTREAFDLFVALRLPLPSNLSATLARLALQGLVMRPTKSTWALTPTGEDRLRAEAIQVPPSILGAELAQNFGSDLGQRRHSLIPPLLAPAGTEIGLKRLLATGSFDTNVMLITRFPSNANDPSNDLIGRLRLATAAHGLTLRVASDGSAEDTLWANVVTYMWGCKYAIVLVDTADGVLNSNVLIEVGGMLMTGRRCAILKDLSVPAMPTDLVGHIYKTVDLKDHPGTERAVHDWIRDDLGLSACVECATPAH